MLYENKERQDFIFTIYHWWQALAIFTVYLWSDLPMKVSVAGCPHHLEGLGAVPLPPSPSPSPRPSSPSCC